MMKKIIAAFIGLIFLAIVGVTSYVMYIYSQLPVMITIKDYNPLLVSEVYDRSGNKIGEFSREKRTLVSYEEISSTLINAFVASEDSTFFEHSGINYFAIIRAFLANLRAGEKVQGASTITQQVARSLLLSNEKTYTRKIKEILLAYRMESHLSKKDILYLYLNQIFLGQNAYGVSVASEVYFNKPLKEITLPEAAILAGLPKAPTDLNPARHPERAKERQRYVLKRMAEEKFITDEEAQVANEAPIKIYTRRNYWELAPYFLETIRQTLIAKLGEETVLDKGIRIYTGLDLPKQQAAQKQVQAGLRELDKRQGYRGPLANLEDVSKIAEILLDTRNGLLDKQTSFKIMQPDGTFLAYKPLNLTGFELQVEKSTAPPKKLPVLPDYIKPGEIIKAVITKVDDEWGLTYVRFAESVGLIDVEAMKWARVPDANVDPRWAEEVKLPSKVFKKGDVILVKVLDDKFSSPRINEKLTELKKKSGKKYTPPENLPEFENYAQVELEQEPETEGALLSIDQKTDDIIAMVGGYDFSRSQLNRTMQTARQTGSSFKTLVYTAALDKGYTPATQILDAPIVYEEEQEVVGADNAETITKKWKPTNHSNRFVGDILFRNALIQSLNVPSVKIIEKIGVDTVADYARRLGVFSPLNLDFTLALGSSSVTLYEMTKVFAQIGRLGRRSTPILIHKVEDKAGKEIYGRLNLDERFETQLKPIEEEYEARRKAYLDYLQATEAGQAYTPPAKIEGSTQKALNPAKESPIFFKEADQLIKPETAYVMQSLLQSAVEEEGGTGGRARSLGRPAAGKTGTTNQYYDAWFLGFTPNIVTGVWVGYDHEKTLGRGEVGARSSLPIWLEYMKFAHEGLPVKSFNVPDNIVLASIDNDTGKLASSSSKTVVRQAFIAGTEPSQLQDENGNDEDDQKDFYKEDLSD
ncbi:MAG: penicillin-binding protein 1A [Bdellovibrionales bacterium RBG_16_40_8]|nr:MAG: penicillin-binding protein 1A [Bdellovibrionales bacterium RBG_16_40_8]